MINYFTYNKNIQIIWKMYDYLFFKIKIKKYFTTEQKIKD